MNAEMMVVRRSNSGRAPPRRCDKCVTDPVARDLLCHLSLRKRPTPALFFRPCTYIPELSMAPVSMCHYIDAMLGR